MSLGNACKRCSVFRYACFPARKKQPRRIVALGRSSELCTASGSALRMLAAAARSMQQGDAPSPESLVSCEIGAVRLTEAVPVLAGRDGTPGRAGGRSSA